MYCKKCGTKLTDEIVFCPKCGNKVSEANKSNKKNSSIIIGIIAALVLVAGIISVIQITRGKTSPDDQLSSNNETPDAESSSEPISEATSDEASEEEAAKEETEESTEPENQALQVAYYNDNYSHKEAFPFLIDFNGDGIDELIVVSAKDTPRDEMAHYSTKDTDLTILKFNEGDPTTIYSDEEFPHYSLVFGDAYPMLIYDTKPNYTDDQNTREEYYTVGFDSEENAVKQQIEKEAYDELSVGAISLDCGFGRVARRFVSSPELFSFKDSSMDQLIAHARENKEIIADCRYIYSGGDIALFATVYPQSQIIRHFPGVDRYVHPYANVYCIPYGSTEIQTPETINLASEADEYGDDDLEIYGMGIFDFGNFSLYYVAVNGIEYDVQHKYSYENRQAYLLDDQSRVDIINETPYTRVFRYDDSHSSIISGGYEYIELTYKDGQFYQISCSPVDESELESYPNYEDVKNDCLEKIKKIDSLGLDEYEATAVTVSEAKYDHVMKGSSGRYYLCYTFKISGSDASIPIYFTVDVYDNTLYPQDNYYCVEKLESCEEVGFPPI